MNENRNEIRAFLYLGNALIMAVHVFLFSFFALTRVNFMAVVNVASVLTYIALFFVIKYEKSRTYILVALTEIIAHMLLAVACVGWYCGFQYYVFGAMAMVFYTDYFFARARLKRVNTVVLSLICAASFPVVLILSKSLVPGYILDDDITTAITVINALFMFIFAAVCFWLLVYKANFYENELTRQANHDKLTELVNRNYLIGHLQKVYDEEDMADYWLAMMDIDDFKKINDTYGHNCGDYVLKNVANLISENSCGMTPCRWGGEEFILVGRMAETRTEGPGSASFVMEKVRRAVEKFDFRYESREIKVTVTIGLSRYAKDQSVDEWINAADEKLYQGKQSGKNRLVV